MQAVPRFQNKYTILIINQIFNFCVSLIGITFSIVFLLRKNILINNYIKVIMPPR